MRLNRRLFSYCFIAGFATIFTLSEANASQTGKIIVDQAELHQYPQSGSKVLTTIKKDEQVSVSNVPTEGFYKARAKTGEVGWISGNDLFVKGGGKGNAPVLSKRGGRASQAENMRFQLLYGIDSLSYSGLSDVFLTSGLGGKSFALEGDFRLSPKLFWAIRVESHSGSQTDYAIGTTTTQSISQSILPIQFGINYSALQAEKLRVGLGAYLGMAVVSSTTVSQTTSTQVEEVKYSSMDPCATFTLTGDYALMDSLGILLEAGYRYHKTGDFPATTRFGGRSGFAINYSGITVRLGLELKL